MSIGTSRSHPPRDDNFGRRRVPAACHQNVRVPFIVGVTSRTRFLTPILNHPRYDDPLAEPVVVHRRSKATKQIAESSQEKFEDSTTQAVGGETDADYTDIDVDN